MGGLDPREDCGPPELPESLDVYLLSFTSL
jgi:hypothetical protein